jgi:hypothetical protein
LVNDLTGFLDFIGSPMRGTYSVRLDVGLDSESPLPLDDATRPHGTDLPGVRAWINVGDGPCGLIYRAEPAPMIQQAGKRGTTTALVRVPLYPGEGYFANPGETSAWICPTADAPLPRVLHLFPD